jgi:hypothetical protein
MNTTEDSAGQPVGLDVGTSRIVVARNRDNKQHFDAQLNAFVSLPNFRLTESLLTEEKVFHEVEGSKIVVAGSDAQRFADMFHVEVRRPMRSGVLNPDEPESLAVVQRIIGKLVGPAAKEGQRLSFSVPAPVGGEGDDIAYHEASIRQILTGLGYQATPINEGLAVVLGEMAASNYTGIAISFGSGLCNVCLAALSLPVITFSVPKAGDFIDTRAAKAIGELATRMRTHKERSFQFNGVSADRLHNALAVYYEDVIRSVVDALVLNCAQRHPKLEHPVPLVLSGGTAMPKGFLEQFDKMLRGRELPFQISEVRLALDPRYSTARGALVAAHI